MTLGALVLTANLLAPAVPIIGTPTVDVTRNIWTASAVRMVKPQWAPLWIGTYHDLKETHDTLTLCASPAARAAGWSCREGNPTAGGNGNAGRIAVTAGVYYGIALLLTWQENHASRKAGEPVRFKWWEEAILTTTVGAVRGFVGGERNRRIAATIRMDIGR